MSIKREQNGLRSRSHGSDRGVRWLKLLAGLIILSAIFFFFASGYSPPGISGEVLRHNQANDIDASPLLYSEVEHMPELERGVRIMRENARAPDSTRDSTCPVE